MRPFFFLKTIICLFVLGAFSSAWATKRLVFLGDSLTEGYGVAREAAYPALIQEKINADKLDWAVINAGVSGSTSASALSRLRWQLKNKPDLLVLALGANDGLRGLQVSEMEKNLAQTIELAQKEKIGVVLAGMFLPPNYTKEYARKFRQVFPRLAKRYHVTLIPFLLEGVAARPDLNQADGMHPNEKGHRVIAERVYKVLRGLL